MSLPLMRRAISTSKRQWVARSGTVPDLKRISYSLRHKLFTQGDSFLHRFAECQISCYRSRKYTTRPMRVSRRDTRGLELQRLFPIKQDIRSVFCCNVSAFYQYVRGAHVMNLDSSLLHVAESENRRAGQRSGLISIWSYQRGKRQKHPAENGYCIRVHQCGSRCRHHHRINDKVCNVVLL